MANELPGELVAKIRNAKTLNEIWAAFNDFYELNDELGAITGQLAKAKIIANLETIVKNLNVRRKGTETKKRFLNF